MHHARTWKAPIMSLTVMEACETFTQGIAHVGLYIKRTASGSMGTGWRWTGAQRGDQGGGTMIPARNSDPDQK